MNWWRALPAILLVSGLGLSLLWAQSLRLDVARLEAENASLNRSVIALREQAALSRLAREVEIARAERQRARTEVLSDRIETISTGESPDADLDPDLADLLNSLRDGN